MVSMKSRVFFEDKFVDSDQANLSIASSAVLYGLSVYTVFTVCMDKNGQLNAFRLSDHFKRLLNSAKIIGIDTFSKYWTYKKFQDIVKKLLSENDVNEDVYLRATVHVDEQIAGTRSKGMHSILSIFIYNAEPILGPNGNRLQTSMWRRIPDNAIPSRAKVNGAYVNSVLAKQDAINSGHDDCIFLDINGHVCELSAANIFIVRDGMLITPNATSDLLEGINRMTIIEIARDDLGLEVVERTVDHTELYIADEIFACGTSTNVAAVTEVDSKVVADGKVGPITKKLQKIHLDLRHDEYAKNRGWLTKV